MKPQFYSFLRKYAILKTLFRFFSTQVVEVLKRCLVRDPVHRASIEELLNHPYLKAGDGAQTSTDSQQGPKTPSGPNNKNLAQVTNEM